MSKFRSKTFSGPIKQLKELIGVADSTAFDEKVFAKTGVFVVRSAIKKHSEYLNQFQKYYNDETEIRFNPVEIIIPYNSELRTLAKESTLLKIACQIFGNNVGLYNFRFIVKDSKRSDGVFLHQDIGYHFGGFSRVSVFVALTESDESNGSIGFFPGTHNFGYLADVGEINRSLLPPQWPVFRPRLSPGDIVVMHSSTWHFSDKNFSGKPRILADVHYQPASDPTTQEVVCGEDDAEYHMPEALRRSVFKRSRASRIVELQKIVGEQKDDRSSS
jgi:hypothetical protein